jgi:cytosine/adenosine deaminase-related metal-dependent hydrolase
MSDVDCLIENGTVITMDPQRRVLDNTSVAIANGKIVEIGPAEDMPKKYRPKKTINARRKVVMPGLVDLHGHVGNSLIKQVAGHFPERQRNNIFDFITSHTSRDWWYLDSVFAGLEKMKFGTTTSLYMLGNSPRSDNAEIAFANAEGVEKIGIRSIIGVGPSRPSFPRDTTSWENGRRVDRVVTLEESLEKMNETIGNWSRKKDSRVQMWAATAQLLGKNASDPLYDPANTKIMQQQLDGLQQAVQDHGVGFHAHGYGTDIKLLNERAPGLLGRKTVLAHGWPLEADSIGLLAKTKTSIAHCPRAEQVYSQQGRLPLPELINSGVNVGLGTDVTGSDRSWNLWEDIFFGPRLHRRLFNDPTKMPVGKILEMATIDGAKALGMEDRIGSLEPGKDADIIMINMWKPHIVPSFEKMTTQRVAYFARGSDVEFVMVAGRVLMENRRALSVDENEVLEWADAEARHTVDVFGLKPMMQRDERFWKSARH